MSSQGALVVKKPSANSGDIRDASLTPELGRAGFIPELGRSPREENVNPLQYSCLENPMDRRAWRAAVHGVTKSQTRLKTNTHSHINLRNFQFSSKSEKKKKWNSLILTLKKSPDLQTLIPPSSGYFYDCLFST